MTVVLNKETEAPGEMTLDARKELAYMRTEIERYRTVFDSARLIVGHELNRPLTSISGYVELLEDRLQDLMGEKDRRYFRKIRGAISDLEKLVEAYVQMLRIDWQAHQSEDLEDVDLRAMVDSVAARYSEYPAGVENCIEEDFPAVALKKNCVEIVLDNLVSNAIKHGDGISAVRVSARIQADRRGISGRELLLITIEDHGSGIPDGKISEVFNPFFRGEAGKTPGGLGLGLTLVKNVMNIMMGDISINSKAGKGTKVTVSIPLSGERGDPRERIG